MRIPAASTAGIVRRGDRLPTPARESDSRPRAANQLWGIEASWHLTPADRVHQRRRTEISEHDLAWTELVHHGQITARRDDDNAAAGKLPQQLHEVGGLRVA